MTITRFLLLFLTVVAGSATPIYITSAIFNTVGEWDATTGAVIKADFIRLASAPSGLALSGNTLFVASGSTVGAYDATTGAAINANFITGSKPAVSCNTLFVINNTGSGTVGAYDATTGAAINANLITGLNRPYQLALSGNMLYVVTSDGTVGEYDATTGAPINAHLISGIAQLTGFVASGNTLFVASQPGFLQGRIGKYDATSGAAINANFLNLVAFVPTGLAVLGNRLFVAETYSAPGGIGGGMGHIDEFDATTGALIDAGLITGLAQPLDIALPASASSPSALQFVPVEPCRVLDTRYLNRNLGAPFIAAGASRTVPVQSSPCGIPGSAQAYALNVTVIPKTSTLGYLTIGPGQSRPAISTLNSPDGSVRANAAIVPAGTGGEISVFATDDTDVVIDVNGYFTPPAPGALQFYPLTPCRIMDTRNPNGTFGGPFIGGGSSRAVPIPSSSCAVPPSAQAYSLNVTVVPRGALGYLTAWPTGQPQPVVSTLNSQDGTVLANAAIVPAGAGGAASFYASNDTDLVLDINGYFAPPGRGGLRFYVITPCRVADTRNANGPFGGPILSGNASPYLSCTGGGLRIAC